MICHGIEVEPYLTLKIFSVNGCMQAVSTRARLLPFIANSLSRMAHAESPVLRLKIASFTSGIASDDTGKSLVINGIEKAVWETILAATQKPVLRSRIRHDATAASEQLEGVQDDLVSQHSLTTPYQPESHQEEHMAMNEESHESAWSVEQSPCVMYDIPTDQPFWTSSQSPSPVLDLPCNHSSDVFGATSPFSDSLTMYTPQSGPSATWPMSPMKAEALAGQGNHGSSMKIYEPDDFERFEEWNAAIEAQMFSHNRTV